MVDERVERDARAEARGLDAQAEVVVLEVAGAEALLEAADALERVAAGEQAEADDARHGRGLAAVARPRARRRRRRARPGRRTDRRRRCRPRAAGRRRCWRAGRRARRRRVEGAAQAAEPAGRDERVVVQQQHGVAAREREALVAAGGEARVAAVEHDAHVVVLGGVALEERGGVVGRAVVDEDQLVALGRVRAIECEARAGQVELAVGEDHDRGQVASTDRVASAASSCSSAAATGAWP